MPAKYHQITDDDVLKLRNQKVKELEQRHAVLSMEREALLPLRTVKPNQFFEVEQEIRDLEQSISALLNG